MKIYYIAHCRFPSPRAHAIQIAKMTEAMRLAGADVHLIVPRRTNAITQISREFYGLRTDIPVHFLPVLNAYSWGRIGYFLGGVSFLASYWFFLLSKKIRGESFLLYTIDMDEFSFIGVSFLGVPFVMEIHGAKKYGMFLNRMFTRARAILTINSIIKRTLVENFNLPPEKVLVHPNGIDIELFSQPVDRNAWRARWHIPQENKVALYVGKCYDWKGMEIFDEAFHALPHVTFAFVGCTKKEFEKVTGAPCTTPNALFFGERPYAEMPQWMKSADILLVIGTKRNDYSYYQTSPMKLFEYMATAVPILAPSTPAIHDVVSSQDVFFYEPDNIESFVENIKEILRDTPRAQSVASRARESAEKLSWEYRAKLILEHTK